MIYLDSNATTRLDPRVLEAMLHASEYAWANPSSDHALGKAATRMITVARQLVATHIGATSQDIIFTSGATEAVNLAIFGNIGTATGKIPHVVTTATEHSAVLGPLEHLEQCGRIEVTVLNPRSDGTVSAAQVAEAMRDDTQLVAIGHGNNEIGAINPIQEIGQITAKHPALFLVDAAQTLNFIPPSVDACNIDLLAMSSHKMHGPKGIGALYVRHKSRLQPLLFGGGQEHGYRSGTLPTELIAGFGKAAELATKECASRSATVQALATGLFHTLTTRFPDIILNGPDQNRLPGNLNITVPFVEAERLLKRLPDLALSRRSACHSAGGDPSHVLWAIGLREPEIHWTFRIGISCLTMQTEINAAGEQLCREISALRGIL